MTSLQGTRIVPKIPTPRTLAQTTTPQDAMIYSQQSHIDELVQKNRTLEFTNKKLKEEVSNEEHKSRNAVLAIRTQWQEECHAWREAMDKLQACHRNVELHAVKEIREREYGTLLDRAVVSKERLAKMQRDFRIRAFQDREFEMEQREQELLEELREQAEWHQDELQVVAANLQHQFKLLKANAKDLVIARKEKQEAENEAKRLREENATLTVDAELTKSKLERSTLQLDGAQTSTSELRQQYDELKRNNAELKRQLEKWQNLETKGGEEAESLRKRRVELEIQVKELENRLESTQNRLEESKAECEKIKGKMDKYRGNLKQWQDSATQWEAEALQAVADVDKAKKKIAKLKEELENERAKVRSSTADQPAKKRTAPSPVPEEVGDEEEVEEVTKALTPAKPSKSIQKPRPNPKPASKLRQSVEEAGHAESESSSRTNGGTSKPAPKPKAKPTEKDGSEAESSKPTVPPSKPAPTKAVLKPKPKSASSKETESDTGVKKSGPKRGKVDEHVSDSEPEIVEIAKKRSADPTTKGKKRVAPDAGDDEPAPKARPKPKPKSVNLTKATKSSSAPKKPIPEIRVEEEGPKKPKKRKLNSQASEVFVFDGLGQAGNNKLNIPTTLSPVRELEPVPSRSNASLLSRASSAFTSVLARR